MHVDESSVGMRLDKLASYLHSPAGVLVVQVLRSQMFAVPAVRVPVDWSIASVPLPCCMFPCTVLPAALSVKNAILSRIGDNRIADFGLGSLGGDDCHACNCWYLSFTSEC